MPNVPTTTPGPDDTEHTLEDVTETIPLITNVHADKQSLGGGVLARLAGNKVGLPNDIAVLVIVARVLLGQVDVDIRLPVGLSLCGKGVSLLGVLDLIGAKDPETGKPKYESPVSYWMPFEGNMIGFHDATWQNDKSFDNAESYKS